MMRSPRRQPAALLGALLLMAGCGDDPPIAAPTCQIDSTLVAQRRACVDETHCPCGTSCQLGVCVASCTTDSDCGGGVCDSFGECRSPNAGDLSPAPRLEAPARIVRSAEVLEFAAAGDARKLRLTAADGDLGPVRVLAPKGYAVRCSAVAEPADECTIAGVLRGDRIELDITLAAEPADVEADALRIFHATDRYSVGLVAVARADAPLSSGRYVGFVRATHHGVTPDDGIPVDAAAQLPVRAEVFLEDGIIRIVEPQGALHPDGVLVGSIGDWVEWPDYAMIGGAAVLGADVEVVVNARTEQLEISGSAPTLAFDLHTTFRGIGETGRDPFVRWSVVLERVGNLEDGSTAPSLPDAVKVPVVGRATLPTEWSTAVTSTFDVGSDAPTIADGLGALRLGEGQLDVCQPGQTERLVAAATKSVFDETLDAPADWATALESASSPLLRAVGAALTRDSIAAGGGTYGTNVGATNDTIPCQFAIPIVDLVDSDFRIELGSFDACDRVASRFGCVPERSAEGTTLELTFVAPSVNQNVTAIVERVCRPTATWTAAGCAEMALCYDPIVNGSTADRSSMVGSILERALDVTGDLTCGRGARSAGLVEARSTGAVFDVLGACARELDRARVGPAPTTADQHTDGLNAILDADAGCLDPARFFFALDQASAPLRDVDPTTWLAPDRQAVTLAHHLVGQWLSLHALVAREATELDKVRAVVDLDPSIEPERLVPVALDGLALLLHPRFSSLLLDTPAALTAAPDYRLARYESEPLEATTTSLPVVIVETLSADAVLLERMIVRAARRGEDEMLVEHARFLRMEAPLRAMAANLAARADAFSERTGAPAPAWSDRYRSSLAAYQSQYASLLGEVRAMIDGKNPLGVEDGDLPLYFFGDENTASSQFTAVSDFLLGRPGSPTAWVPNAIASADDALDAARNAGLARQDRAFERTRSQAELDDRLDDIRRTYGQEMVSLCGLPAGRTPLDVLESSNNFNANDCFISKDDPACQVDTAEYEALMSIDDVRYQFCVVNELRARTAGATSMVLDAWNDLSQQLEACDQLRYGPCADGVEGPCMTCKTIELPPPSTLTPLLDVTFDALCEADALPGCDSVPVSPALFRGVRGVDDAPPALLEEAQRVCQGRHPTAVTQLPGPSDLEAPRDNSCFGGALGGMVLNLDAVATDIDIARSELADLQAAYDIAMTSCIIQQTGNDTLEATQAAHDKTMQSLRKQKASADNVAAIAGAAKDCASTAAGVTNPFAAGAAAVSCAAGGVEAGATVHSTNLQRQMDDAEASHESLMASLENQIEEEICFNDAEMHLVGVRTASLRIERAAQDLNLAMYEFNQAKQSAQVAYDSGRSALEIARGRFVQRAGHDFWFDEQVDTFEARMRIARRLTFLAVRAVEYEFQQSLDLRADTLAADLPGELEAVVAALQSVAATRAIRGSRPADLKVVLSLRKNLLQLTDLSSQPEGWHQLDEKTRFRRMLASPRYAAYDAAGRYVGQQIPFDLAPLGTFELGQSAGIPVLAANDCAERLWSVNASIMGDGLYRGDAPTFTRIDLLKANTFYSQWCSAPADGSVQVGSVRPSKNLFQDPRYAATVGENLAGDDKGLFTRARIEAYFNVSRADFESDDYASGATSELAARGLYGGHALFIPAQVLSEGEGEDGLVLGAVDDILLRLDYVSVAQ